MAAKLMSIIDIITINQQQFKNPDVPLRNPCIPIDDFGDEFQKKVDDLIETFWKHRIAVGLAAPQVGIAQKFAVINQTRNENSEMLVLVNPIITSETGKKDRKKESCMSVPDFAGEVERRKKITIEYQDRYGSKQSLAAEGFLARVIQHEVDHLEGILYIDRMENLAKIEKTDLFKSD
jgi:peptide deformylase